MAIQMTSRSQSLHQTNQRLRHWLDSMLAQSGRLGVVTPGHITALLSELSRAGAELRANPLPISGADPELDQELNLYCRNVELLRERMPSIHNQLLAERARLEAQRAQVRSAADWAEASRQTL
ncbi:MAG: hypothetical protein WBM24_20140 [Candidatus Sulfotelmatobacter sp.]